MWALSICCAIFLRGCKTGPHFLPLRENARAPPAVLAPEQEEQHSFFCSVGGGSWLWSWGARLVPFPCCLAARPLESRESRKGLGPGPGTTRGVADLAQSAVSDLRSSVDGSNVCSPGMAVRSHQREAENTKYCGKDSSPNWLLSSPSSCSTWVPLVQSRALVRPRRQQTVEGGGFPFSTGAPAP